MTNPYTFLPLPDSADADGAVSRADAESVLHPTPDDDEAEAPAQGENDCSHMRHDVYGTETAAGGARQPLLSGRIICRVTTLSPCVFGNEHEQDVGTSTDARDRWAAKVNNFELDRQPAIAPATLRGCIGSLVEALSGSSMRVLIDRSMSMRSTPAQARSAIGMVWETSRGGATQRSILPLTRPPSKRRSGSNDEWELVSGDAADGWRAVLAQGALPLPTYLDGYAGGGRQGHDLRSACSFLGTNPPPLSFGAENQNEFWFLPFTSPPPPKFKRRKRLEFLVGEQPAEIDGKRAVPRHDAGSSRCGITWKPGIIRRLAPPATDGITVPSTKKHEVFVPLDGYFNEETGSLDLGACTRRLIPAEEACDAFERAAWAIRQTYKGDRPLRLMDGSRFQEARPVRLRHGDLVHFRLARELDPKQNAPVVGSVAISAIWRENAGALYDYFRNAGLEELLPWTPARTQISPAEQLLGFVEAEPGPSDADAARRLRAYASRIRFSPARYSPENSIQSQTPYMQSNHDGHALGLAPEDDNAGWFPLNVLSSPKPPSPGLYFVKNGKRLQRTTLPQADGGTRPRGWKFYLHDPQAIDWRVAREKDNESKPLKTDDDTFTWESSDTHEYRNQKMLVRPLRPGAVFFFHVDFDNLKAAELTLLRKALEPYPHFCHKMGLGKPIGLGSARVEILGTFLIDRERRYQQRGMLRSGQRYHRVEVAKPEDRVLWPDFYELEQAAEPSGEIELPEFPRENAVFRHLVDWGNPRVIRRLVEDDANSAVKYPPPPI